MKISLFFFFIKDNVVEGEMHVDPKHHRYFVARRGEVLKHIGDEFGGVTVSFPRSGVKSDKVVIKGSKDCVEGAKRRIQEIVEDLVCIVNKHMLKIFAWCKTSLLMIINIIENWLFLHSCIVHYCFCSVYWPFSFCRNPKCLWTVSFPRCTTEPSWEPEVLMYRTSVRPMMWESNFLTDLSQMEVKMLYLL